MASTPTHQPHNEFRKRIDGEISEISSLLANIRPQADSRRKERISLGTHHNSRGADSKSGSSLHRRRASEGSSKLRAGRAASPLIPREDAQQVRSTAEAKQGSSSYDQRPQPRLGGSNVRSTSQKQRQTSRMTVPKVRKINQAGVHVNEHSDSTAETAPEAYSNVTDPFQRKDKIPRCSVPPKKPGWNASFAGIDPIIGDDEEVIPFWKLAEIEREKKNAAEAKIYETEESRQVHSALPHDSSASMAESPQAMDKANAGARHHVPKVKKPSRKKRAKPRPEWNSEFAGIATAETEEISDPPVPFWKAAEYHDALQKGEQTSGGTAEVSSGGGSDQQRQVNSPQSTTTNSELQQQLKKRVMKKSRPPPKPRPEWNNDFTSIMPMEAMSEDYGQCRPFWEVAEVVRKDECPSAVNDPNEESLGAVVVVEDRLLPPSESRRSDRRNSVPSRGSIDDGRPASESRPSSVPKGLEPPSTRNGPSHVRASSPQRSRDTPVEATLCVVAPPWEDGENGRAHGLSSRRAVPEARPIFKRPKLRDLFQDEESMVFRALADGQGMNEMHMHSARNRARIPFEAKDATNTQTELPARASSATSQRDIWDEVRDRRPVLRPEDAGFVGGLDAVLGPPRRKAAPRVNEQGSWKEGRVHRPRRTELSPQELGFEGSLGDVLASAKPKSIHRTERSGDAEQQGSNLVQHPHQNKRQQLLQQHESAFNGSLDVVLVPDRRRERHQEYREQQRIHLSARNFDEPAQEDTNQSLRFLREASGSARSPSPETSTLYSPEDYVRRRQEVQRIRARNSGVSSENPLIGGRDERFVGIDRRRADEHFGQQPLDEILGVIAPRNARSQRRGDRSTEVHQGRRSIARGNNEFLSDYLGDENLTYDFLMQLDKRVPRLGLPYEKLRRFKRWMVSQEGKPLEGRHSSDSITKSDGGDEDSAECPICFEVYAKGDYLKLLPCGHYFHEDCLIKWFKHEVTCPLCRFNCHTNRPTEH